MTGAPYYFIDSERSEECTGFMTASVFVFTSNDFSTRSIGKRAKFGNLPRADLGFTGIRTFTAISYIIIRPDVNKIIINDE